ncbi:heavy metal-associated domain-containing protein [Micromonospora sp. WMMD1155]|uniref:heavy-metal-associated domain-containing protein n=1 Tax=Micromonospora sp. WMMD1155 TaxID=3016094 RepID=UPI00249BEB7F|nr:heavy metal-associated domain-containing protein [Micromonospora sp. WMMD1155]WFE53067.1 heavy metal-associated domain-containing protein [Micromonospora sp. WMMD1155]
MNETVTYMLSVRGLCCDRAESAVRRILEALPGVHRAHVSVVAGRAVVDADPAVVTASVLAATLAAAGYPARLDIL